LQTYATAADVPEEVLYKRWNRIRHEPDFECAATALGGSYHAPYDTQHLPYGENQVDLVISNLVLQCVPVTLLKGVVSETARILKPGGCAIHRVGLMDEYARDDPQRNDLDYLRFSHKTWNRFFNHSIKHLNRLRYSHFIKLFQSAGLEIESTDKEVAWSSYGHLRQRGVADEFSSLSWEDLLTTAFRIVLRKPRLPINE
jgi:SAM-dependent methyltransferase